MKRAQRDQIRVFLPLLCGILSKWHNLSSPRFPPESGHHQNSTLLGVEEVKADHVFKALALGLRNDPCDDD